MAARNVAMREAIRRALREEMHRDENVFVMGEEVAYWQGTHRVTRGFLEEFGERRVRDTPISEMAIGGMAVGAAMAGLRPVAEFMTINFAFLALDAIANHAAKVRYFFDGMFKAPLVYRGGERLGQSSHRLAFARAGADLRSFPRHIRGLPVELDRCLRDAESLHSR